MRILIDCEKMSLILRINLIKNLIMDQNIQNMVKLLMNYSILIEYNQIFAKKNQINCIIINKSQDFLLDIFHWVYSLID